MRFVIAFFASSLSPFYHSFSLVNKLPVDYIDGQRYAWQDVPKGSAWLVDPLAGRIGLLNFTQEVPGYLEHIDLHLSGLADSPGHTSQQRMLAIQVDGVITKMENDVMQIRRDAIQLVARTSSQMRHPDTLTLLNDMVSRTNEIKSGWFDATSGEDIGGVVWLQARIQQLATIVIQKSDKIPKTTGD
jgi:hypothetical protein